MHVFMFCLTTLCTAGEEIWTEVQSPHFIVISNSSVKQARRTARLFEQFRLLIQTVMVDSQVDPATPLTVFAAKDEKTFQALLADERQEKGAAKKAGLFLSGPERQLVVVRLDAPPDQTYHVIYHEYVHMITDLNYGKLPLWLSEGLAEFFACSELSDDLAFVGKAQSEAIGTLRSMPLIPLSTLMSATHESPYYRQQEKTSQFYLQSWILVHYLIVGDNRAHSKKLTAFIAMVRNGVDEQDAAKRAFGDLKALESALTNYIQLPTQAYFEVPANLETKGDQYKARALSAAESLALRGELLAFRNKTDKAKAALGQALQLDPRNARANEAMGQLFLRLDNREEARKYFAAAADLNSESCMANFYAAQAITLQNGDPDLAERYLRKAVTVNPEFAPAYGELSQLLRRKSKHVEALQFAKKAESLQPGILVHKINIAAILAAMDQIDEAYEYGRHIAAIAREENDRKQAESFFAWISKVREQKLEMKRMKEQAEERIRQEAEKQEDSETEEKSPESRPEEARIDASAEIEKKRREEIARIASVKPGPAVRIEGTVRSVKCDFASSMELVLETGGKPKILYADNYFKIAFKSSGAAAKTDFQPCRDLEGKRVEIEYAIISSEYFSGLIRSMSIARK